MNEERTRNYQAMPCITTLSHMIDVVDFDRINMAIVFSSLFFLVVKEKIEVKYPILEEKLMENPR